jgi:glycosyltransferase involved in cell wall biosynthesis
MKVLHLGNLDAKSGGPAMSSYFTLKGLRECGVDAQIAMSRLGKDGKLIGDEVPIHYFRPPLDKKFLFTPGLKKALRECGCFDIYHAQGVWQYPTYALCDVAKEAEKPYLITPRGMLYPQDIEKSSTFFKKMSLRFRLLNDLNNAACVQVTCRDEMIHCRNLGVTSPVAIIPNPVTVCDSPYKKEDNKFRLGYLGRISPRKNVESLIYAWKELESKVKDAELLIMGSDDKAYEAFLKKEVERLQLKNVVFTGFVHGDEKDRLLSSLSVLAMPSEFENLGNVILEALIRRVPCIATKGSPWEELNTRNCGWWVDYNQKAITDAIADALSKSSEELHAMGENGRLLMIQEYSKESVAGKMKCLYEWIIDKSIPTPEFVFI